MLYMIFNFPRCIQASYANVFLEGLYVGRSGCQYDV
jgi:hypothetical protein